MMRKLNDVTEAVAREKSALFVDLAKHSSWDDVDFYDFTHMTPQGAGKVGNLLYDALSNSIRDAEQIAPPDKE